MDEIVSELSHGEMCSDSIYQFYQPKVPVRLEVVFVHGLEHGNSGDAYWKTWLARDGTRNNVWPMTWLPDEFPFAQVFSLSYDATIRQTAIDGRMDLFLLGVNLVQEMVNFGRIGQSGVPVVFVCHGFGGLVAKQIVVSAMYCFPQNNRVQNLLQNIGALLFYSTPHHGSYLANSSAYLYNVKGGGKGLLLENLEVLNTDIRHLSQDFEQAKRQSWYFDSAAEMHVTSQDGEVAVDEASSRYAGGNYLALSVNHYDICKPKTKKDSSYQWLIKCLGEVLAKDVVHLPSVVESLVLDSFVRLKKQEEAIKRMLQKVSIVGLAGMGGIGKTTLAKAVYQSTCKDFENSSYLADVKSQNSLNEVLIKLLQQFGIRDRKTGRIAEQNDLKDSKKTLLEDLKTYVQQHKVLVVVDDVGTEGNFDCLLKYMGFLNGNKESRLIVTCRNWQELKKHVLMDGIYEVEFMRSGEDTELLSYHAFKGARTLEQQRQALRYFLSRDSSERLMVEFESLFKDVAKACGGLPLSLEVIGGCLGGYLKDLKDGNISSIQCLEYWKGAVERLKNAVPLKGEVDQNVNALWKVFKTSYNDLHKDEQNMFLAIACFFCGSLRYDAHTLLQIWGENSLKSIELRNLKERCLVNVNKEDGIVTMHDHLRDMGRNIVSARYHGGPALKHIIRLWDSEDVSKLLQSNEDLEAVSKVAASLGLDSQHSISFFTWAPKVLLKVNQVRAKMEIIAKIQVAMEELSEQVTICCTQSEYLVTKSQQGTMLVARIFAEGGPIWEYSNIQKWVLLCILLDRFICCMMAGEDLLHFCAEEDWKNVALSLFVPTCYEATFSKFALVVRNLDCISEMLRSLLDVPTVQQSDLKKATMRWISNIFIFIYVFLYSYTFTYFSPQATVRQVPPESDIIEAKLLTDDLHRHACDREIVLSGLDGGASDRSSELEIYEPLLRKRLQGDSLSSGSGSVPLCFWIQGKPKYEYIAVAGAGSNKAVLICKWLGQLVAIAEFLGERAKDFLEAEAGILARVQHPNVINLIACAYDEESEKGYLVTELMDRDLLQLITKKRSLRPNEMPFSLSVSMDIILQIVEAMIHMRKCRVLHRDLKPKNIVVNIKKSELQEKLKDEYYVVKLIDFGASKLRGPDSSNFQTRKQGTSAYMAPEVHAMIGDCKYTWHADVFSFGMTCYEIMSGKYPFEGVCEGYELTERICAGKRPLFPAYIPTFWKELIEKCWHHNPKQRPSFLSIRQEIWECYNKLI